MDMQLSREQDVMSDWAVGDHVEATLQGVLVTGTITYINEGNGVVTIAADTAVAIVPIPEVPVDPVDPVFIEPVPPAAGVFTAPVDSLVRVP